MVTKEEWDALDRRVAAGEAWRHRADVAKKCPFNPMHGGCHYPDCGPSCAGYPADEKQEVEPKAQ